MPLGLYNWGMRAPGPQWLKPRDAPKYCTVPRRAPHCKDFVAQNMTSAEVKKPCSMVEQP